MSKRKVKTCSGHRDGKKCRKPAKSGSFCWSCIKDAYKERHPERYAYQTLRNNVKRRNRKRAAEGKPQVPFDLTLEQFIEFAIKVDYMKRKGITRTAYHIDRIEDDKGGAPIGYTKDNIQALENHQNVKKYHMYRLIREYDYRINKMTFNTVVDVTVVADEPTKHCPF